MTEVLKTQDTQGTPAAPVDAVAQPGTEVPRVGRLRRATTSVTARVMAPLAAVPSSSDAVSSPEEVVNWVVDNWQALGTAVGIIGTGVGVASYLRNRRVKAEEIRIAHERNDNELFHNIVTNLGNREIDIKANAARQLLQFCQPGYERFHQPIFQIAVDHFRSRIVDPDKPRLNRADQAFLLVFLEAASRIRENLEKDGKEITPDVAKKFLNASGVHLDGAEMEHAKLANINLRGATFNLTNLSGADLSGANLSRANLSGIDFSWVVVAHEIDPTFLFTDKINIYRAKGLTPKQRQLLLDHGAVEESHRRK